MTSPSGHDRLDFNILVSEIEAGSGGSIAAAIKKLRDHELQAYVSGVGGPTGELVASFISALNAQANERITEIERTCAHHYQGFLEAAKDLLGTQNEASRLQEEIQDVNKKLSDAVKKYTASCKKLSDCKMTLAHIDQCIEGLNKTIPVLEQYSLVERSISEGRFYHALRKLEDLEHTQMAVVQPYAFSVVLRQRIPQMRANIKTASLSELTDFLEHIRKHSIRLGILAMRETAKAMGIISEALIGPATPADAKTSSTQEAERTIQIVHQNSANPEVNGVRLGGLEKELEDLSLIASDRLEENLGLNRWAERDDWNQSFIRTEDLVDFGPVYRCLHIHTALHERAEFERDYCTQRRKQCQLILSLSASQQQSMRNYAEFFGAICGFFVVDDHLRLTLSNSSASYQTYLDELWSLAVERLVEFARLNAGACRTPDDLIRLKDFSVLLNRTMTGLGFNTTGLLEMITWVQKSYQRLLSNQWKARFSKIIKEDNFSPIVIPDANKLHELSDLYPPCLTAEFEALPYPRHVCYSWMVPRIYKAIREYIDLCVRFCAHVDLTISELEDTVNRATNSLFTDFLNDLLKACVRESERKLPHLLQLCTNVEELETACGHLDTYLLQVIPAASTDEMGEVEPSLSPEHAPSDRVATANLKTGANSPRSRLYGPSLLKDIRDRIETSIYNHLNFCVDEFIGLVDYSQVLVQEQTNGRLASDAGQAKPKPNGHIVDLVKWLSTTFNMFANIPPKVSQTACLTVLKHIHSAIFDMWMRQENFDMTDQYIRQMNADLAQCEAFARSQPVPGLDSQMLCLIFTDLRQLVDLFAKDDWAVFFSKPKKREGDPYDRVSPTTILKLLDRVRDTEKKRTGFLGSMFKGDSGRKKQLDDLIRQLREVYGVKHHS